MRGRNMRKQGLRKGRGRSREVVTCDKRSFSKKIVKILSFAKVISIKTDARRRCIYIWEIHSTSRTCMAEPK